MTKSWEYLKFDDLIGKEFNFFGAAEHEFRLDDIVWKAVEDEEDGYRSHLDTIQGVLATILYSTPLARVRLSYNEEVDNGEDNELYRLTDVTDGHIWLTFGTKNTSDYYPYFVFDYQPKEPK
jgi:hypothetical protein